MNIRQHALCIASLALICLPALVAPAKGSSPLQIYSITPYDADAKLIFTLTDQKNRNWIDLFTSPSARAAVSQWQAVSDTPVNQGDTERQAHLLMLLYWQSCLPDSTVKVLDAAKAPHSGIDVQEANKLRYAPAGLPTEVLSNAFNKDSHWYQAALQQILTAEKDPQDQENTEPLKKIIEGTGQARDVFTRMAESLDQQAATGGMSAARLKAEAAGFRVLAGSVTLIKDQGAFKFKISAALCKRLPHALFSGQGVKTVALPLDKALVLIQLASTFNQKMAVSSEKARQLAAVLDYASANHVPLNADFEAQSRSLCDMAGHLDLVLVATFLDTTVDWIKRTAVTTSPSAMAVLSRNLAEALAKAAPDAAGYFSTFASSVVDRFSLLFAADAGANLLFNTSGTYGSIKTAEFCYDCAQQLDNIGGVAHSQLSNSRPSANSLTSWAMAGYFREVAVSAYHQDYADLLQGGRVATWVANLVTSGGPEASIDYHNKVAHQVGDSADEWVHPVAMDGLLKLFHATSPPSDHQEPMAAALTGSAIRYSRRDGSSEPGTLANWQSVNLNTPSIIDWRQWGGTQTEESFSSYDAGQSEVKKTGNRLISPITINEAYQPPLDSGLAGADAFCAYDSFFFVTWADGLSSKASRNNRRFVFARSLAFTVPADISPRTLTVWAAAYGSSGKMTAELLNQGGERLASYEKTVTRPGPGVAAAFPDHYYVVWTFHFRGSGAGQSLGLRWQVTDAEGETGNVGFQAAALSVSGSSQTIAP